LLAATNVSDSKTVSNWHICAFNPLKKIAPQCTKDPTLVAFNPLLHLHEQDAVQTQQQDGGPSAKAALQLSSAPQG
jgi:hypothetical protein